MTELRAALPDAHAHLDAPEFDEDRDLVVERALAAGIAPILSVGTNLESSRRAVEIAHRYDQVFAAVGIHPTEADRFDGERDQLQTLLSEEKVVAVGEIGLDYVRGSASPDVQRATFREQVQWCRDRGIPASVHNRGADLDILDLLDEVECVAILHCFSGSWETAERAVERGNYVSFGGNVTFPKSDDLRTVVRRVPMSGLLVESDSPVLAPQSHRGRRNEPAFTALTADIVSGLHELSMPVFVETVSATANRIFGWGVR